MILKKNNLTKVVLFISSYFPMYIIVLIQNVDSLWNKIIRTLTEKGLGFNDVLRNKELFFKGIKRLFGFKYLESYIILFFLITLVLSFILVHILIRDLKRYKDEAFQVTVVKANSVNYQYILTYFSAYIFPFITLNLSSLAGILQFIVLWLLIGYLYVKNNLIYINPLLNIFYKYNVYETKMEYTDEDRTITFDGILLSKQEKAEIVKAKVIKESEGLYIESM